MQIHIQNNTQTPLQLPETRATKSIKKNSTAISWQSSAQNNDFRDLHFASYLNDHVFFVRIR